MSTEAANDAKSEFWVEGPVEDVNFDRVINMEPTLPMTGNEPSTKLVTPSPNPRNFVSRQRPNPNRHQAEDPDKYLMRAKALVVQNYNEHRDEKRSPTLNMDLVFVTWFAKASANWKAVVCSSVVRGLLWEVSFNAEENEAYLDVYRRLRHVRIPFGE